MQLNAHEARVLGVLIEKAFTTPEQYPQTLNAVTNGCNQKSCRIPVLDFSQAEVTISLSGLQMKQLAGGSFPSGSRVEKWHHSALEHFSLGSKELALLAELLLRGAQSPSELRTRASRMHPIAKDEISSSLGRLEEKQLVRFLPSGAGARTERWAQTLAPDLALDSEPAAPSAPTQSSASNFDPIPRAPAAQDRVTELESRVARLESQLRALASELGAELPE
ncbi:MAG: hypothetical protein ACI9HE_003796 [Planctomycetota bacterium]|jgi:uncharacterized protein YceH (UPF0502 family)